MDIKNTPFLKISTLKNDILREDDSEGQIRLRSAVPLRRAPHRMTQRLLHWAKKTPDKVFLAQRDASGHWQTLTYETALKKVKNIAHHLLQTEVSAERPLAILSENSIEHGLMALAALHIGIPYSPIAPAYSLKSTDFDKLRHTIDLLEPGLIFVQNGRQYENALRAVAKDIPVVAVHEPLDGHLAFEDCTVIDEIFGALADIATTAKFKAITPETIAKILFTSGSTGLPKGVMNTHGNITANWQQITQTFPFFKNGGLTLVDWLPWNHTFGGNHNFGLTLFNGGSLYIDGGNPTPKGIETTLRNIRDIAPTVYFNVPKGFEELIPYFQQDPALCGHFFSRLKMFFYAGAGMPQHVWDGLEALAYQTTGKRLMIGSGLGMTEGSPSCMFNTQLGSFAGAIGTPVPGLEVKLVPDGGKLEARFRGPNIAPGYWRNPEATDKAFDEEGYYRTGDALKFNDPDQPNAGMAFDGRIAEDFKLDTGTWVNVGILRAKFIAAGSGLVQDVVITGHNRAFLGAIVFPELNFCKKLAGLGEDADLKTIIAAPKVIAALQQLLHTFAQQSTGSSTLIRRAVFADTLPSMDLGEITDKGSINQRAVLANRATQVAKIYEHTAEFPILEVI
jgi:feruloyl-CoA synthase